jgi:membrane carboxypeptidase/penicillin-binding protein PbpC
MGITTMGDPDEYDLSIALGGGEVQLLELTEAYGAFANGGYRVQPQSILEIQDFEGNTVYSPPRSTRSRVLDARVAWLISDILNDNEARRTGFGSNSILQLDRPAAVKTGTTTNFHDNWTVGYTPDLVVGVWSGNSNYEPMREVNGLTGAAPIWHQFMRAVLSGKPKLEFIRPEGLVHIESCALSGLLPSEECQYRRWEWFIQGTQPTQKDRFFREVIIDSDSGILADDFTPQNRRSRQVILDLPPQAHQWAHSEGLTIYSDLIPGGQIASSNNRISNTALQLVSPAQNSAYWLTPGFDASAQRLRLEASGISGLRDISIWVDGVVVAGFSKLPYKAWWILSPGLHEAWVEAISANGELIVSDVITFSVHTK